MDKASDFNGGVILRQKVVPGNVWVTSKAMNHLFGTFKEKEWIIGSQDKKMYFEPDDIYVVNGHRPDWCQDC